MGTYGGIQDVADRAAFYGSIQQMLLSEMLEERLGPDYRWDVRGDTIVFSNAAGDQVSADATVTASVAPGPRSLMWGWAIPNLQRENNLAIRRLGERFGIHDLTNAEVLFAADEDEAAHPLAEAKLLAWLAGLVALEAVRTGVPLGVQIEGGTQAVYHLEGLGLPELTMAAVVSRVGHLVTGGLQCRDFRSATLGLSEHLGWDLRWADAAGSSAELSSPSGESAVFSFDGQGRITGVEARL